MFWCGCNLAQGAVGITVCVGGVNHLTAKRLESRSMKQLLQDKNLSIWSSKDSSMPLASVTLALMLSQGKFGTREIIDFPRGGRGEL